MNILTTNGLCVRFLHRLGGPRGDGQEAGHPPRRPRVPERPAALHRKRHRQDPQASTARASVEVAFKGSQQPRRSLSGHRGAQPARRGRRMSSALAGKAAIVGIGQTEFSKESGRSEMQLACEAVKAAIDDAGLQPSDVDGMVTFTDRSRTRRSRSPATSASATSPSSPGSPTAAARPRAPCCRPRWPWRPVWPTSWCATAHSTNARGSASAARTAQPRRDAAVDGALRAVRLDDAGGLGRAARSALHVRPTASPTRTSARSPSSTASTPPRTPTRGSTRSR